MKKLLFLLSLAVLACVLPAARAEGVSGVWKGSFEFNDQTIDTTFKLAESGATVTGTVEGLPTSPAEIHDGKLEAGTVSFWVNSDYQGSTYKLIFKGKVKESAIDFAFGTDDGAWGTTLIAKREGVELADVNGTWKGSFDLFGSDTPIVFNLKNDSGVVTGTVLNADGKLSEIHEGKFADEVVSFWINSEYRGEDYKVEFKGKLAGGNLEFNFGIPDGSWNSYVTAKKN